MVVNLSVYLQIILTSNLKARSARLSFTLLRATQLCCVSLPHTHTTSPLPHSSTAAQPVTFAIYSYFLLPEKLFGFGSKGCDAFPGE